MPVFIDYLTLLLVNMVAGFVILAAYMIKGLDDPDQRRWGIGFAMAGLVALIFGTHMVATWPLPGAYNSAFGEMSVLWGIIFFGAGLAMMLGWDLKVVALYAFVAAAVPAVLAVRFFDMDMTKAPALTAAGFLLSGLAALFALPTLVFLRHHRGWRIFAALVLMLTALIWLATAVPAFWSHMEGFADWQPLATR